MRERAALGGGYAWYNDFTQEDSQGNVVQTFFGNGVKDSSGWTFAFSDLYGTPRGVCDASKNTVRMAEFTPYGLPYLGMASGAQGGFTGHTFDDVSGFHRAAYRNYSPVLGRWTSREPSGIDGPNLYWYGVSRPSSFVDKTGLAVDPVTGTAVLGAALTGGGIGGFFGGWDQHQRGCSTASVVAGTVAGAVVGATTGVAVAVSAAPAAAAGAVSAAAIAVGSAVGATLGFFDSLLRNKSPKAAAANAISGGISGGAAGAAASIPGGALIGMYTGGFLYFGDNVRQAVNGGYFASEGGGCVFD